MWSLTPLPARTDNFSHRPLFPELHRGRQLLALACAIVLPAALSAEDKFAIS